MSPQNCNSLWTSSKKSYLMASLNLCVHISRASTSLMVQKGADKRKDEDLMKGLKNRSKMLNLHILKYFQHLSKPIKTMMASSPWKNMSRFSGWHSRDQPYMKSSSLTLSVSMVSISAKKRSLSTSHQRSHF